MKHTDVEIMRAARKALQQGHPWLNLGEVYAYTNLACDKEAVKKGLDVLVFRGDVVREPVTGKGPRYRLANRQPKGRGDERRGALRQSMLDFLGNTDRGMLVNDIADALCADADVVRSTLSFMARKGEVVGRRSGTGPAKLWQLPGAKQPNAPQRDPRCDCENPEPESGAALVSTECPVHNDKPQPRWAPGRDDGSEHQERYAYRSDGTLLIELPVYGAVELSREETDRLFLYLSGVHDRIQAALEGAA